MPAPLLSRSNAPIYKNSTGIPKMWKVYREKPTVIDLGVIDEFTVQVKVKMSDVSCLALLRTN